MLIASKRTLQVIVIGQSAYKVRLSNYVDIELWKLMIFRHCVVDIGWILTLLK